MIAPGISRRSFMTALGLGTAGLAVHGSLPGFASRSAAAATNTAAASTSSGSADGVVVVVTLYGGNDGLNTVVPYADPAYSAARQALAVSPAQVLRIDSNFGFHPSLTRLSALFNAGRVGVIHGVGYPNFNRSHFRSMDIWQTARPTEVTNTGWLGRWFDATGPDPLRMINIGGSVPRSMIGTKGTGANLSPGPLKVPGGAVGQRVLAGFGRNSENVASLGSWGARIAASNAEVLRVHGTYGPLIGTAADAETGAASTNLEGDAGGSLTRDLTEIARLIAAGAPARVYGASLGGFDTHASELDQHARLLAELDRALGTFHSLVSTTPRGQRVTVMVHSEFGRRVQVNGSDGTDHGAAAPVLVLGPAVRGGQFGTPPSLTDLDGGDLKFTTDFRSVYATLLGSSLGVDPVVALGTAFSAVPFL